MWSHKYSALVPQIQDMCIRKLARRVCSSWMVDRAKIKLPHSFILLHSHCWIQYTSDSHLKQISDYRQVRKLLLGASRPRRGKPPQNGTYSWQFRCINSIHIVPCMTNSPIYVCIVGVHVKRIVMSCFM